MEAILHACYKTPVDLHNCAHVRACKLKMRSDVYDQKNVCRCRKKLVRSLTGISGDKCQIWCVVLVLYWLFSMMIHSGTQG